LKKKEAKRIKEREREESFTLSLLNICLFFFSLSRCVFFTIEIHSILERKKMRDVTIKEMHINREDLSKKRTACY
jgi:hypothetical protein